MAIPCVPTLGSQTFLTDVSQILVYIFRTYVLFPKNRSDIYNQEIISYMDDVSRISYDKTIFATTVEDSLKSVYDRIFENTSITASVDCSVDSIDSTKYELSVTVQAVDNSTKKVYVMAPSVINSSGVITIENDNVFVDDAVK